MKIYKDSKYNNKRKKDIRSLKKRVLALSGIGIIVLCGINIAKTKAEEEKNNIKILEADEASFPNVDKKSDITDPFKIGSGGVREVNDYLYGPMGKFFYEYSEAYGVDPNIMCAIAMQESSLNHKECIPGGSMYYGYGVGLMQLESPEGQEIRAYNYKTGEIDVEYITMENACDPIKNIKIGCMIFQNSLNYNDGNVLLAIQSHNYGQGMIDLVLDYNYSNAEDVKQDYKNIEWIRFMKEAHENPSKYIYDWDESKYGDGNYISNVLRYCPVYKVKYSYNGKKICFNLRTLQIEESLKLDSSVVK